MAWLERPEPSQDEWFSKFSDGLDHNVDDEAYLKKLKSFAVENLKNEQADPENIDYEELLDDLDEAFWVPDEKTLLNTTPDTEPLDQKALASLGFQITPAEQNKLAADTGKSIAAINERLRYYAFAKNIGITITKQDFLRHGMKDDEEM